MTSITIHSNRLKNDNFVPELVTTYLRFAVSHVLQYQLEHLHCIFLLLFVSSENHRLFDWVLGGWEGEREERERETEAVKGEEWRKRRHRERNGGEGNAKVRRWEKGIGGRE